MSAFGQKRTEDKREAPLTGPLRLLELDRSLVADPPRVLPGAHPLQLPGYAHTLTPFS